MADSKPKAYLAFPFEENNFYLEKICFIGFVDNLINQEGVWGGLDAKLLTDINNLTQQFQKNNADWKAQLTSIRESLTLSEVEAELTAKKEDLDAAVTSLEAEIEEIEAEALEAEALKDKKDTLEGEKSALEADIVALEAEALEAVALEEKIKALKDKKDTLEGEKSALAVDIVALEGKNAALEKDKIALTDWKDWAR